MLILQVMANRLVVENLGHTHQAYTPNHSGQPLYVNQTGL